MWLMICHLGVGAVWAAGTWRVWRARRALGPTTLLSAWYWTLPAVAGWWLAWLVAWPYAGVAPRVTDHVWYTTAILTLCPFVAVLGARRPTVRIWSAFVVLPLLLVLEWPALSAQSSWSDPRPLDIEAPAFVALGLVLVMGVGNYLPTRFAAASGLLGLAVSVSLLAFADGVRGAAPGGGTGTPWDVSDAVFLCRTAAVGLLGFACCIVRPRSVDMVSGGFECLWSDFRDWFGIVWARRLQDRINATALQKGWPLRLEMHGLRWSNEQWRQDAQNRAAVEQAFRWLLRRFVDHQWIDARLGPESRNASHDSHG